MNINNVPTFLKARSPKGLRRLMLMNNLQRKSVFKYDIMQDNKTGVWYAWYQIDATEILDESFNDLEKTSGGSE